jgi:prepilin-type N-terminal cleavage/methylation domain-containing protein
MNVSLFNRQRRLRQLIYMEDGFTLLEVVVSLGLILILITGLLNLLLLGIKNVSLGGGRTAACIYAVSLLEEMKARPEILAGVVESGQVRADSMPFLQSHPPGIEAAINLKPLEGAQQLYVVNLKVLTTGGENQWEECLVGVVPAP